jgi:hypothetical protein
MMSVIVGDPTVFAIESNITQSYSNLGQRALGYFVIHLAGSEYGVRSPDATLLACSFDAVQRRIARQGTHCILFDLEVDSVKIVEAFRAATYDEDRQEECFFGMSGDEFRDALTSSEIVWAPDGDAAFDDGSHVLQFDYGNRVRLIAFKNEDNFDEVVRTLAEVWVSSDEFYGLLEKWQCGFEVEWAAALKLTMKH